MRTKLRNKLIVVLTFLMLVCMSSFCFFTLNGNVKRVSAEETAVSAFYSEDGATVALDGTPRLRFKTVFNKAWYDEQVANGYTVTFHGLLGKGVEDIETLTPSSANVYDDAFTFNIVYDKNNEYAYYYSLSYEGLDEAQLNAAYKMEISYRGYAVLSKDGEADQIVYSDCNDTTRSIRAVANMSLLSGKYTGDDETALKKYLGETIDRVSDICGYYNVDATDETFAITVANAPAGEYDFYIGAKKITGATFADGVVTLPSGVVTEAGEQTLSLIDANGNVYSVQFEALEEAPYWDNTTSVILATKADDGNVTTYSAENSSVSYVQYAAGRVGVFKWEALTEAAKNNNTRLKFNSSFSSNLKLGDYLSFDIYMTKPLALYMTSVSDYSLYKDVSDMNSDIIRFYNENGERITSGNMGSGDFVGQWITIEFRLQEDYIMTSAYRGLAIMNNLTDNSTNCLYGNDVYIDNIVTSKESRGEGLVYPEIEEESNETPVYDGSTVVWASQDDMANLSVASGATLTYVEEAAGRTGVLQWASTTAAVQPNVTITIANKDPFKTDLASAKYLSFDIYMSGPVALNWTRPSASSTVDVAMYGANYSGETPNYKIFDVHGNRVTTGDIKSGSFNNQWITIEIWFPYGHTFGSTWRGLTVYKENIGTTAEPIYGTLLDKEVYIDNMVYYDETRADEGPACVYDQKVIDSKYLASKATCTSQGTYYYSCIHGKMGTETFIGGELASHIWTKDYDQKYLKELGIDGNPNVYYYKCSTCLIAAEQDTFESYEAPAYYGSNSILSAMEEDGNVYAYRETVSSITYVEEAAGRGGVWQWASTVKGGQQDTQLQIASGYTDNLKAGRYLSFDIYVSKGEGATNANLYLMIAQDDGMQYVYDTVDGQYARGDYGIKLYDEEGNFISTGAFSIGSYENQWITVEYELPVNYVSSNWRAFIWNLATNFSDLSKLNVYIDNVVWYEVARHTIYTATENHDYSEKVVANNYLATPATCQAAATYYYSCACGKIGTETFSYGTVADHTGGEETCTSGAICSVCGVEYTEALGHVFDKQVISETYLKANATCISRAEYYYSCSCGEATTLTFRTGELAEHDFTAETVSSKYRKSAATCTALAVYYHSCAHCGLKGTTTFTYGETLAHDFTAETVDEKYVVTPATCTEQGVYYYSCSVCGEVGEETFTVDALGHSWVDATCTAPKTCSVCSETEGDALGHTTEDGATATCTEGVNCTVCGEQVIAPLGHTYPDEVNEENLAYAADCKNPAGYYKNCSTCGELSEEIFSVGEAGECRYDLILSAAALVPETTDTYYLSCPGCGTLSAEMTTVNEFMGVENGMYFVQTDGFTVEVAKESRIEVVSYVVKTASGTVVAEYNGGSFDEFKTAFAGLSPQLVYVLEYTVTDNINEEYTNAVDFTVNTIDTVSIAQNASDISNLNPIGTSAELAYVEGDIGGRKGAYEWTSGDTTDGSNKVTITLTNNTLNQTNVTAGKYLYFDFYTTRDFAPVVWHNKENYYIYNATDDLIRMFDASGNLITSRSQSLWNGKWVTIELHLEVDYEFGSNWRGIGTPGNNYGLVNTDTDHIYLDNFRVSTYSIYDVIEGVEECEEHTFEANVPQAKYLVSQADCDTPMTFYVSCSVCGAVGEDTFTYGEALGHTPEDKEATCTTGVNCTVCGEEVTAPLGHQGGEANCTTGAICTVCGVEYTDALGHQGGEANCESGAICTLCGVEYTDALGHTWVEEVSDEYLVSEATCQSGAVYYKSCETCGEASDETFISGEADANAHAWVDATCEAPKTCSICGTTEGDPIDHVYKVAFVEEAKTAESTENNAYYYPSCVSGCGNVDTTAEAVSVRSIAGVEAGMVVSSQTGLNLTTAEGYTATRYTVYTSGNVLIAAWVTGEDYSAFNTTIKTAQSNARYVLNYTISDGTNEVTEYVTFSLMDDSTVQIFVTEDQSGNVIDHTTGTTRNEVNYVAEAAGRTGVLHWDSDATSGQLESQIALAEGIRSSVKKDMYLTFDIWLSAGLHLTIGQDGGTVYAYGVYDTSSSANYYRNNNNVRLYDEQGRFLTTGALYDGSLKNQWVTVEWQMTADWAHTNYRSFLWNYTVTDLSSVTVYLDNIVATTTSRGEGLSNTLTVLDRKEDLDNGNMTVSTYAPNTTLTYVAEAAGRKEIFQWATTDSTAAATETMLWFSKPFASYMKVGTYLVFDIYVESGTLTLYSATAEQRLYGTQDVVATEGGSLWDAEGNKITSGSFNAGSFAGQWVTVQVQLEETYATGAEWRGLGIETADYGHQLYGKTVYLDNVRISTSPVMVEACETHDFSATVADAKYLVSEATCSAPMTFHKSCSVCGAEGEETFTYGEALGHTGGENTCQSAATCTVCGTVYGEIVDHNWLAATCTKPATCSFCGLTNGEPAGHSWTDATCTEPKTCSVCNSTEGTALGHSWLDATCTEPTTCSVCGETEGEALGHTGGEATCESGAKCEVCGTVYGDPLGHTYTENATEKYLATSANCVSPATYYTSCEVCGTASDETFEYGSTGDCFYDLIFVDSALVADTTDTYYLSCTGCGTLSDETTTVNDFIGVENGMGFVEGQGFTVEIPNESNVKAINYTVKEATTGAIVIEYNDGDNMANFSEAFNELSVKIVYILEYTLSDGTNEYSSSVDFTLNTEDTVSLATTASQIANLSADGSAAVIEYVEGDIGGRKGAYEWSTTSSVTNSSSTINLKENSFTKANLVAGKYLYFDLYTTGTQLRPIYTQSIVAGTNGKDHYLYSSSYAKEYSYISYFNQAGSQISNSSVVETMWAGKWVTVQFQLQLDYEFGSTWRGLMLYADDGVVNTDDVHAYIDNIRVSDSPIYGGVDYLDEQVNPATETGIQYSGAQTITFVYQEENVEGLDVDVSNSYRGTATTDSQAGFKFDAANQARLVEGAVLSFEYYTPDVSATDTYGTKGHLLHFDIGGTATYGGTYSKKNGENVTNSGGTIDYFSISVTDMAGNAVTSTIQSIYGKWVKFEFTCLQDFTSMSRMGLFILRNPDNFYIRNMKITMPECVEHDFSVTTATSKYLVNEADCDTPKTYYVSCSICGEAGEETFTVGEALGHTGGNATCLELATCEVCGESYGEYADHIPIADATCTDPSICAICGETLAEALGHSFTVENTDNDHLASSANCQSAAKYYYTCSICGVSAKNITNETFEVGEVGNHQYDTTDMTGGTLVLEATCQAKAVYQKEVNCSICDGEPQVISYEVGEKTEHDFSLEDNSSKYLYSPATCTSEAIYFYACADCGTVGWETWVDTTTGKQDHKYTEKVESDEYYSHTDGTSIYYFMSCTCGLSSNDAEQVFEVHSCIYDCQSITDSAIANTLNNGNRIYYYSCECGEVSDSETFTYLEYFGLESGLVFDTTNGLNIQLDEKFTVVSYTVKDSAGVTVLGYDASTGNFDEFNAGIKALSLRVSYVLEFDIEENEYVTDTEGNTITNTIDHEAQQLDFIVVDSSLVTSIASTSSEASNLKVTHGTSTAVLEYVHTDIGNRTGAYRWTVGDTVSGTAQYFGIFGFGADAVDKLNANTYLTFDFYTTGPVALKVNTGTTLASRITINGDVSDLASKGVKFYDAFGKQITSGSIANGDFDSQWITVEVLYSTAYSNSTLEGITLNDGLMNGETVYIANVMVYSDGHETTADCTHVYDQQVASSTYLVSAANCEGSAEFYYSCRCGAKGTETFTHEGHNYGNRVVDSEATCGSTGSETRTCLICGTTETIEYTMSHSFTAKIQTEAYIATDINYINGTCYYYACVNCGAVGEEYYVVYNDEVDVQAEFVGANDFNLPITATSVEDKASKVKAVVNGEEYDVTYDDSSIVYGTVGAYTLTYTYNEQSVTVNVKVYGTPVITGTSAASEITVYDYLTNPADGYTATDSFGNALSIFVLDSNGAENADGSVNAGTYSITLAAMDNANQIATVVRTVTITSEAPQIESEYFYDITYAVLEVSLTEKDFDSFILISIDGKAVPNASITKKTGNIIEVSGEYISSIVAVDRTVEMKVVTTYGEATANLTVTDDIIVPFDDSALTEFLEGSFETNVDYILPEIEVLNDSVAVKPVYVVRNNDGVIVSNGLYLNFEEGGVHTIEVTVHSRVVVYEINVFERQFMSGQSYTSSEGIDSITLSDGYSISSLYVYLNGSVIASYIVGTDDYNVFNNSFKALTPNVVHKLVANMVYTYDGGSFTYTESSDFVLIDSTTTTMLASSRQDLVDGIIFSSNTAYTTLEYVEGDIGGRTAAYKWSAYEACSQTDSTVRFKENTKNKQLLVAGNYITFDIYTTGKITLFFSTNSGYSLIYNGTSGTCSSHTYQLYDSNGEALTSGTFWNGSFNNQWITVEICLTKNYIYSYEGSGISIWNNSGSIYGKDVYLANFKVSTVSMGA